MCRDTDCCTSKLTSDVTWRTGYALPQPCKLQDRCCRKHPYYRDERDRLRIAPVPHHRSVGQYEQEH